MTENDNKLNYYRSELKMRNVFSYKLIGISSDIILSFEMFPRNDDLVEFLKNIYEVSFRPYVYKSRTLIVAKIVRRIYVANENELDNYRKNLLKYVTNELNKNEIKQPIKKVDSDFGKWMDGISNVGKKDN